MRSVRGIAGLVIMSLCLLPAGQTASAKSTCQKNGCRASCDIGYAVCSRRFCGCTPDGKIPATVIDIGGDATADTTITVEVYDIACEELPCEPLLTYSVTIPVLTGQSAPVLANLITDAFMLVIDSACVVELLAGSEAAVQLGCAGYYPAFRICESSGGNCPDIFEPGVGTDPELGVDLAGFSFLTRSCCTGRVGDANGNGGDEPTIGDISVLVDAKFISGTCYGIIDCREEADVNQSGGLFADCDHITIGDISMLIDYLFITGTSLGLADCL